MNFAMETVDKDGQMVLFTKDSGNLERLMDKVNFTTLMVTSMRENGLMIKLMAMAPTLMQMALNMSDSGETINNTVLVLKLGLMEQSMKETTQKERSTVGENLLSQTDLFTKGSST
jgi:hypothetical protein